MSDFDDAEAMCSTALGNPATENHGDWGVVPSSLGLIVVIIPQPLPE